jgi:hypothetical protein
MATTNTPTLNDVAERTEESKEMCLRFDLIDALIGGTAAMRAARTKYMPKRALEEEHDYEARLRNATLFPAYTETVKNLTGRAFAEPMQLGQDVPEWIAKEVADDADRQGRKLAVWAADWFRSGLHYGLVHALVDSPETGAEVLTQADQERAGVRPYVIAINPRRVLGWQLDENGSLAQVRIAFRRAVRGAFATSYVDQVRVYEPGKVDIYEKNPQTGAWLSAGTKPMGVKGIPLATFYTGRTATMEAVPPLLELAYLNAKHWSMQASNDSLVEVASIPVMVAIGVSDDSTIAIGEKYAVNLPDGADLKYVEHSGKAIECGRNALQDLKDEMRQAGAKLVERSNVGAGGETKTAKEAGEDATRENSALGEMCRSFEDSMAALLDLIAEWRGDPDGGTVELFPNLDPDPPADSMTVLTGMNARGSLSSETVFNEAKRRGILDEDLDWDEERARIESDPLAVLAGENPSPNPPSPPPARSAA